MAISVPLSWATVRYLLYGGQRLERGLPEVLVLGLGQVEHAGVGQMQVRTHALQQPVADLL